MRARAVSNRDLGADELLEVEGRVVQGLENSVGKGRGFGELELTPTQSPSILSHRE